MQSHEFRLRFLLWRVRVTRADVTAVVVLGRDLYGSHPRELAAGEDTASATTLTIDWAILVTDAALRTEASFAGGAECHCAPPVWNSLNV